MKTSSSHSICHLGHITSRLTEVSNTRDGEWSLKHLNSKVMYATSTYISLARTSQEALLNCKGLKSLVFLCVQGREEKLDTGKH